MPSSNLHEVIEQKATQSAIEQASFASWVLVTSVEVFFITR